MIIPLLVKIICNDVSAVQSIILPVKHPFLTQNNDACEEEAMVKRSNSDERGPNERFENVDLKATFDDPEQKETTSLAQKLANEALRSPQLQRNIKKLANLSGTLRNHSKMKALPVDRMNSVLKPTVSTRKLNKLLNRKGKGKRRRDKRKHGLKRLEKPPRLRKRNHLKVSKSERSYNSRYFLKCKKILPPKD